MDLNHSTDDSRVKPSKVPLTKEEKISNYMESEVADGKSSICRFLRRGLCLFSAEDCKFAHGAYDLQFKKLPYNDSEPLPKKDKKKAAKKEKEEKPAKDEEKDKENENEKEKEEEEDDNIHRKQPCLYAGVSFKDLYQYQFTLIGQGKLKAPYTQEEIDNDEEIRRSLKAPFHVDLQRRILDLLYVIYETNALKSSFVEKCFKSIDWMMHWKYFTGYVYETKGGRIVRQLQGESFDEFMEDCLVRIIKECNLIKQLPITSAAIMKHYYSHLGGLDPMLPPHHVYLRHRDAKNMDEYLHSVQYTERFKKKLGEACGLTADQVDNITVFEHLGNEFQELTNQIRVILLKAVKESEIGFFPYSAYETQVTTQCAQETPAVQ